MDFDYISARAAHRLFELALTRWRSTANQFVGPTLAQQERDDLAVLVHGHCVEVLMWTRALDDFCTNADGIAESLTSYIDARPQVADLLDGARYVCNKALHRLVVPSVFERVTRLPMAPLAMGFAGVVTFHWAPESALPPASHDSSAARRELRRRYIDRLAGTDVAVTMHELHKWFARHFA